MSDEEEHEGRIFAIDLGTGQYGFARALKRPLYAFYEILTARPFPPTDVILSSPILFRIWVMDCAEDRWSQHGFHPLEEELRRLPLFFKKDAISGQISIYDSSTSLESPSSLEDVRSLECAAVWAPEHIEDRLRAHSEGRACDILESLRPD